MPQDLWNIDNLDGTGESGVTLEPDTGIIANWPYTWYNQGKLYFGIIDDEELVLAHVFEVDGEPSLEEPNLPIQYIVDNDGAASALSIGIGGMQYSLFGAGNEEVEQRRTNESRITTTTPISDQRALTEDAVDPSAQPGYPLVSLERKTGFENIELRIPRLQVEPVTDDIWVFAWDEWDKGTALTGATFNDIVSRED